MCIRSRIKKMEFGFIYKVKNNITGKSYVGQAREKKYKKGVSYNYGVKGRWNDHVSSACVTTTPLAEDIRKYGKDVFELQELQKAELDLLDALEADWIKKENTCVPIGYNVMKYSRNKHHKKTNIADHFKDKAVSAELRKIRRNGEYLIVYCCLTMNDGTTQRITFGQNKDMIFDDAWNDAIEFAIELDIPFTENTSNSEDPLERYADKIKEFDDKEITKIRITRANNLVAVYITTAEMKNWKDQKRICFGGKTIKQEEAYELAKLFIEALTITTTTTQILDVFRSSQQVDASMAGTEP